MPVIPALKRLSWDFQSEFELHGKKIKQNKLYAIKSGAHEINSLSIFYVIDSIQKSRL